MSAPPLSWVFPFLVSPIYSISPCLSYSPRRQCFLGRSPGYSSQGIRGPPPGGDVGSNHGGGPRGLSPTQYLFWFLKGDCTCRDGLGTTQMDNLITDDALLPFFLFTAPSAPTWPQAPKGGHLSLSAQRQTSPWNNEALMWGWWGLWVPDSQKEGIPKESFRSRHTRSKVRRTRPWREGKRVGEEEPRNNPWCLLG